MEYRWQYPKPVNILDMELAEFDLTKTEYIKKDVEYVAGIYDLLNAPQGSIETEYFTEDVEYVAGTILNTDLVHMSAR